MYRIIALIVLASVKLGAQNANPDVIGIIKKASDKLNTDAYYAYDTQYKMYEDYESNRAKETYAGFLLKKNNIYYYKIKNTEFVGFKNYSVMVSNDEKSILISKQARQQFPLDLSKYLKGFTTKLLKSDKNEYVCELVPTKISQIMVSKIVLHINKSDYSIIRQKLYLLNPMENDEKSTKPRLEVTFRPKAKKPAADDFLVTERNYYIITSSGYKIANRYKKYNLYKA